MFIAYSSQHFYYIFVRFNYVFDIKSWQAISDFNWIIHLIWLQLVLSYFRNACRYSYGEPVPYRFSNDAYVAKLLLPLRSVADNIQHISFYTEPAKKFTGISEFWRKNVEFQSNMILLKSEGKKRCSNEFETILTLFSFPKAAIL